jgi:hypothetical protein
MVSFNSAINRGIKPPFDINPSSNLLTATLFESLNMVEYISSPVGG